MREPVLVDSTLHRAFSVTYSIYVLCGLIAAFSFPPSVEAAGGRTIALVWLLGLALTAAFSLLWSLQERWQRREMITTTMLLAFLVAYTVAVFWFAAATGSLDRALAGVFSLSFSVFPFWRVQFFFRKFRKPRG